MRFWSWVVLLALAFALGAPSPATADDSCRWAFDGVCDEPGACPAGTDSADCADSATDPTANAADTNSDFEGPSLLAEYAWSLGGFLWTAFALAAYLLFRAQPFPGRRPLLLGFAASAIPGFLAFLMRDSGVSPALGDEVLLFPLLNVAAGLLLVLGVWLWIGNRGAPVVDGVVATGDETSVIPRNDSNSISRAEQVRDAVYDLLQRKALEEELSTQVYKSPPHSRSVWVRIESSKPHTHNSPLALRSSATVLIEPREFHRFDPVLRVVVSDGKRVRNYSGIVELPEQVVSELLAYLGGRKSRLRFRPPRVRELPWQLTRPLNKPVGIETRDWDAVIMNGFGWVLFPLYLIWVWRRARERPLSLTSGKPHEEPRRLQRLDSWQTVLKELGPYTEKIRAELMSELSRQPTAMERATGFEAGLSVQSEDIWYEGVDGKVERDQLVVRLRRGIAFVHLYPYADDLYVGWDAHVNAGAWTETKVAEGRRDGSPVRAYGVRAGWHVPNEYDVVDANFVTEHVHASVTRVVKRVLREHQIDQEVDFQIVRESRQTVIGRSDPEQQKRGRFTRVS